ncbi:MAG: sulfotransferase [Frankiaceae bacterium]|nr:sulfotransferase [Arenimonas sp.]
MKPASRKSRKPAAAGQLCILVMGMHRSGTSAMTRVLNLHGVALGDNLLQPAPDNPRGFWEHRAVVELHERLLTGLGRNWKDPRPLPEDWQQSEAAARASVDIEAIIDSFAGEAVFAVKDPRLCELVELWLPILHKRGIQAGVVLVVRHPMEVAESIQVRDGWTRELSWLMCARSTIDAWATTSQVPRCVVSYERLLGDWRSVMARAAAQLHLEWPISCDQAAAGVEDFLDLGERHHSSPEGAESDVPQHLLDIYEALRRVELGESWSSLDKFADLNKDFQMSTVVLHEELAGPEYQAAPRSPNGGKAQIFYRKIDEPYSEARSKTHWWPDSTNVFSFLFRFNEPTEVDALRIDFDDFPGIFLLDRLEIDGQAVDAASFLAARHGTVLGDGVASTVGLVASDNDPWIELLVTGTACKVVAVTITRIPLNDAVHTMRSNLDLQQRMGMLFRRVASSGDCILANQRAAQQRATELETVTNLALQSQSQFLLVLQQQLRDSVVGASRLDARISSAGQMLDVIAAAVARQARATDALGETAGQQRVLVEQLAAQARAYAESASEGFIRIDKELALAADRQAQAIAALTERSLETSKETAAAAEAQSHVQEVLGTRLVQAQEGIRQLDAGLVVVGDGLRGLDEKLSMVLGKLDVLATAVAQQREELDAASVQAQRQGQELVVMKTILQEVNRSRFGWRLRQLFGKTPAADRH